MKKLLVLSLMAMVLCGCGSNAEPQSATKESAKDADGNYATATVEVTDGKITAISLDEIMGEASKKELGEDYGMKVASKIGKHWHEQVEFLENYIVENGLEAVELDDAGYAKNDDVLAGCTINVMNMINTAKEAEGSLK